MQQRPNELEFLKEVLAEVEDLPQDLARRLVELVEAKPEDRAQAIRRLIEEHSS
jgi:glutamate synthase domain-containing protein 3